jgi:adenine deaminase
MRAHEAARPRERVTIALEGVTVVDVVRGEIVGPRTVTIRDGKIAAIDTPDAAAVPPGAQRVDGHGRFLIPGLVDMHVHLFNNATKRAPNEWTFPLFVANGVTGVREMAANATSMPLIERWRAQAAAGELIAPHVLAAGVVVNGKTLEESRRQVREARAAGADFIKVFSHVREPHWRAILEQARTLRMPVCGHVPAEVTLLESAAAGQRSNEHLTQLYEACSTVEARSLRARKGRDGDTIVKLRDAQEREVLASFDQLACERTATALANAQQAQVATLVLSHFEARGPRADYAGDARFAYLRADEQARWHRILKQGDFGGPNAARRWEVSRQIVATLHAAGVRILAGTDAPMPLVYPGFALHTELQLLVESGLTAAEALRAATIWPAEFLGMNETSGSVDVGKRADLLLLDANPLSDISHTQRIHAVVLDGRLLDRADLDALLQPSR